MFNAGKAKAVGVSNFNITHFEEIKRAGMPLPSLTQNPYNIYRSQTQEVGSSRTPVLLRRQRVHFSAPALPTSRPLYRCRPLLTPPQDLVKHCKENDITFLGYSPFGASFCFSLFPLPLLRIFPSI